MPDLSVLTDRYGPLPGYAWVGVAGVGAFLLIRHRAKSSAPASTGDAEPEQTDPATAYDTPIDIGPPSAGDYTIPPGTATSSGSPVTTSPRPQPWTTGPPTYPRVVVPWPIGSRWPVTFRTSYQPNGAIGPAYSLPIVRPVGTVR